MVLNTQHDTSLDGKEGRNEEERKKERKKSACVCVCATLHGWWLVLILSRFLWELCQQWGGGRSLVVDANRIRQPVLPLICFDTLHSAGERRIP